MSDTYTTDWALAQIMVDGRWEDYARATYRDAVSFVDNRPAGTARVVFWIGKTQLYPTIVNTVDTSDWADYERPAQPYTVGGTTDGESWEMSYATEAEAVHSAQWFNDTIIGTPYNTSWGVDHNTTPARVTHYADISAALDNTKRVEFRAAGMSTYLSVTEKDLYDLKLEIDTPSIEMFGVTFIRTPGTTE
jgi:hypothetical protein